MSATPGLVPSINNVKASGEPPEVLEVDRTQARCTRLRKNLGVAAKALSRQGGQAWMVTLTYARAEDWKPSNVRDCLRHARAWCKRRGFGLRYVWVMETAVRKSGDQKGQVAPHYHLVIWLPHGEEMPHFDAQGWWPHGLTNAVKAVAPVRYVMKYASKFDNAGAFPKGARVYGIGGLDADMRQCRRWINWPSAVQGNCAASDQVERVRGGGWLNRSTGERIPSEWGVSCITRTRSRLVRLRHVPRAVPGAFGPFSWLPAVPASGSGLSSSPVH